MWYNYVFYSENIWGHVNLEKIFSWIKLFQEASDCTSGVVGVVQSGGSRSGLGFYCLWVAGFPAGLAEHLPVARKARGQAWLSNSSLKNRVTSFSTAFLCLPGDPQGLLMQDFFISL